MRTPMAVLLYIQPVPICCPNLEGCLSSGDGSDHQILPGVC